MRNDRRRRMIGSFAVFLATAVLARAGIAVEEKPARFELNDGDRVVLIGGTFIERDQSYGSLESLLNSRFPDRNVTFRNLGWSGDTVWGEARSRFGPPAEGFDHLVKHVDALKPTVIFVSYGLNESFAGKAGLPAFQQGLDTLLNVLDKTHARIVLITPRRLEKLAPPLPDPTTANARLADYVAVLREAASRRKYRVVDLFDGWRPDPKHSITDNGLHLTEAGYADAAKEIAASLGLEPRRLLIAPDNETVIKSNPPYTLVTKIDRIKKSARGLSFQATLPFLPTSADTLELVAPKLEAGAYEVSIDGKIVASFNEKDHQESPRVTIASGADFDQFAHLRKTINAKNELYFYRWRPQNETYLFGFRKHEQGNNAREIPLFDPLVAAREAEIAKLRAPFAHEYQIIKKERGE